MTRFTVCTGAVLAALSLSFVTTAAVAQPVPAKAGTTAKGPALIDDKGMTLYTFDRDTTTGKSACNGPCAENWPPLKASADAKDAGDWTVVTRDDGSKMWAYKGKPVYGWKNDKAAGDTTGDGVNNVWKIAKP